MNLLKDNHSEAVSHFSPSGWTMGPLLVMLQTVARWGHKTLIQLMEQPPEILEPQASGAAPMSLPARLGNIFTVPGEVFASIRGAPFALGNYLAPALLYMVLGWVGAWLVLSQDAIQHQLTDISSKAIEQQIEKRHVSDQQADAMRQAGEKFGMIGAKINAVVLPVFMALGSPFWWGLILWLVGSKGFKGGFSYMKAVEVAGLANIIGVLEVLVRTLLIFAMNNLFAGPGPVLLVLKDYDPQNPVHGILGAINLLLFCRLAVMSIGVARLSGASLAKSAGWVCGIWAAYTSLFMGAGFALQALSRLAK
jgi:hypothetical protein